MNQGSSSLRLGPGSPCANTPGTVIARAATPCSTLSAATPNCTWPPATTWRVTMSLGTSPVVLPATPVSRRRSRRRSSCRRAQTSLLRPTFAALLTCFCLPGVLVRLLHFILRLFCRSGWTSYPKHHKRWVQPPRCTKDTNVLISTRRLNARNRACSHSRCGRNLR